MVLQDDGGLHHVAEGLLHCSHCALCETIPELAASMNEHVVYCFAPSPSPSMNVHISADSKATTLPPEVSCDPLSLTD